MDLVTPFLNQLSYLGLIDETMNIDFNRILVEEHKVFLDKQKPEDPNKRCEESQERTQTNPIICRNLQCGVCPPRTWFDLSAIFEAEPKTPEVRFSDWKIHNIMRVNKQIKETLKVLEKMEIQIKDMHSSLEEIDFKLKFLDLKKFVLAHTALAKSINDALNKPQEQFLLKLSQKLVSDFDASLLEKVISMVEAEEPLDKIFSVLLLANFVNSGFKQSFLETFRSRVFHFFGWKGVQILLTLTRAGLVFVSPGKGKVHALDKGRFLLKVKSLDLFDWENNILDDVGFAIIIKHLLKNYLTLLIFIFMEDITFGYFV